MKPAVTLALMGCLGCLLPTGLVLAQSTEPSTKEKRLTSEEVAFFETKIRPVLVRECFGCHSNQAGNVRGGLRLDTKELTHLGGSSGPAVVPGDLDASLLYSAIRHEDFEMPPRRKLPANVIEDFRQWIEMGAPDPRATSVSEIKSSIGEDDIREAKEGFWAYQPPVRVEPPAVEDSSWSTHDIDRFILARLEASGIKPPGDAEAYQVIRRLCFDLVGLPPTPAQIHSFESDWNRDPQQAITSLVDELLDQSQFGERWGRHWLDVARYAESTGREINMTFPHAWRYRDYVIDSFNADKPFDRFVQEQIAGDLLPVKSDEEWAQNLIATTFLAIGTKNVNETNRVQFEADLIDEQIDATTRVFLGTSVACARCHDHKFDAIPQSDYYALAGIFQNATTYFGIPPSEFGNFSTAQVRRTSSLLRLPIDDPNPFDRRYSEAELERLRQQMRDKLRESAELRRGPVAGGGNTQSAIINRLRLSNEQAQLSARLAVVDQDGNPNSYCMGIQERATSPRDARLLVQGEIDQPAQVVPRGFPQVLCTTATPIAPDSSGRLELAKWIGSDRNPLTARVMVNRIWQHLIGQGIVASTENFGVTGQSPSHPELLDYLAVSFVDSGWSVKSMIREITTSRTYRMGTRFDEAAHQLDPDNTMRWRAEPRRLDAESLRDAMLSISGEIDLERPRGSEVARGGYRRVVGGFFGDPLDARRSVYLPIVRDNVPRSLDVFDFADTSSIIGTREKSNTANQALYMLNNSFVIQRSEALARRISTSEATLEGQIRLAFELVYGRGPDADELAASVSFVRDFNRSRRLGPSRNAPALAAFCQSLFALAEFRYLD